MKSPKETGGRWESTLTRYFAAYGIPIRWDGIHKRFTGFRKHTVKRINPSSPTAEGNQWRLMPQNLRKAEVDGQRAILIVSSKRYGDEVEDSIVVMRLGTASPMLKALIDNDKERWIGE